MPNFREIFLKLKRNFVAAIFILVAILDFNLFMNNKPLRLAINMHYYSKLQDTIAYTQPLPCLQQCIIKLLIMAAILDFSGHFDF